MLFTSKFTPITIGKAVAVSQKGLNWLVDMFHTPYDAASFIAMQDKQLRSVSQAIKPTGEITLVGKKWNNDNEAFILTGDNDDVEVYFHGFHIWADRQEMIMAVWRKGKYIKIIGDVGNTKRFYVKTDNIENSQYLQYAINKLNEVLRNEKEDVGFEFYIDKDRGELLIIGS